MKGRLRFIVIFLMVGLLPPLLVEAGMNAWLSFLEERRNEVEYRRMGVQLKQLKDDLLFSRKRLELCRRVRARLEKIPDLTDAAVKKIQDEFAAEFPGLLEIIVCQPDPGDPHQLRLLAGEQMAQRFLYRQLCQYIAWRNEWQDQEKLSESRQKLIQRQLFGQQVTAKFVSDQRNEVVEIRNRNLAKTIFWDGFGREEGDRAAPWLWRGICIVLLDQKQFDERFFSLARQVEQAVEKARQFNIQLRVHHLYRDEDVAAVVSEDPGLEGILRRSLRGELRFRGERELHVFLPVREADKMVFQASKPMSLVFPEGIRYRWIARSMTAGLVILALILLIRWEWFQWRPWLPVRLQLGFLFFSAALLPFTFLFAAGYDQVLQLRSQVQDEALRRIRTQLERLDEMSLEGRRDMYDLALEIRNQEASQGLRRYLADAPSGEISVLQMHKWFKEMKERVAQLQAEGLRFDTLIYDESGREIYRDQLETENVKRPVEREITTLLSLATINFYNTGDPVIPQRDLQDEFLVRLIGTMDEKHGMADLIVRNRGVIHTLDVLGIHISLFMEPLLDDSGVARAVLTVVFNDAHIASENLKRLTRDAWSNPHQSVKLFAMDMARRGDGFPNSLLFNDELRGFLINVGQEGEIRSATVDFRGELWLAMGRLLRDNQSYAVCGLYPLRLVEAEIQRNLKLIMAMSAAGLLLSIVLGLWIAGRFVRNISRLSEGVHHVEAGELDVAIDLDSPDEFGRLASSFNSMGHKLAQAMHRLERRIFEISTLYAVNQAMHFTRSWEDTLRIILDKAVESLQAEKGSLMLWDEVEGRLQVAVIAGFTGELEKRIGLKPGEGLAGRAFSRGETQLIADATTDQRFKRFDSTADSDAQTRNLLCVPLKLKDHVLGVINITNKQGGQTFSEDDISLIEALATQAAVTIENARLYDLSITDGMTGLYINRYFQIRMDEELKRSARYGTRLTVLFTDVDHFKNFNDTYGHQTGDRVLIQVAQVMRQAVRDVDIPCRYGGEEFAVIAPNTDRDQARIVAERLRRMVEEMRVSGPDGEELMITISIGIATFPEDAAEKTDLIERADQALYHAKENGRNQWARYCDLPGTENSLPGITNTP